MNNTMRRDDGQFLVWADGHMGSNITKFKVFQITEAFFTFLVNCSSSHGMMLYRSDSEKRCNQVAEWITEAQTDFLTRRGRDQRQMGPRGISMKALKAHTQDFKNRVQRIVDSARECEADGLV